MNIIDVINHLRANCLVFNGNVGGTADWVAGLSDRVNLPPPAAYVYPHSVVADPNQSLTSERQKVTEVIAVTIELDNTPDRQGQVASASIDAVHAAVLSTLLNWRNLNDPHYAARGLAFVDAQQTELDGARLFWTMRFSREIILTEEDGWQELGDPLTEIDITDTTTGTTAAVTGLE